MEFDFGCKDTDMKLFQYWVGALICSANTFRDTYVGSSFVKALLVRDFTLVLQMKSQTVAQKRCPESPYLELLWFKPVPSHGITQNAPPILLEQKCNSLSHSLVYMVWYFPLHCSFSLPSGSCEIILRPILAIVDFLRTNTRDNLD